MEEWGATTGEKTGKAGGDGYSFRAVAYDGAGNSGQSSIAGVTLTGAQPPPGRRRGRHLDSSRPGATRARPDP